MGVEGDVSPSEVIKAVEEAGYGASVKGGKSASPEGAAASYSQGEDMLKDRETPALKAQALVFIDISFSAHVLFDGQYDVGMAGAGISGGESRGHGAPAAASFGAIMIINQKFFVSGFKSLWHRAP